MINKVSVRKALKELSTKHYNKLNLFFLGLIIFIFSIGLFLTNNKQLSVVQYTIFSILLIFINGYSALMTYNRIHMRNNIVPSLFTDFIQIIKEGFKFGIGSTLLLLLYLGIPLLISFKFSMQNIILTVLLLLLTLYITLCIFGPSIFYYYRTLKIGDFFKLKEARNLYGQRCRVYYTLLARIIVVDILLNILNIIPLLVFVTIPLSISISSNLISQYAYIDKPRKPVNTQIKQQ